MRSLSRLLAILASCLLLTAAQINTLPECLTACLRNTIPQCSGIKCYCTNLNSTTLPPISSCYHTLCDSTNPDPFDIVMADIGPLCFQQNTPVQQDQIDAASAIEASSSFSTYLSLSDGPKNTMATVSAVNMVVTSPSVTGSAEATGSAVQGASFQTGTRARLGADAGPTATGTASSSVSKAGARKGGGDGRDGLVAAMVMGLAGVLLQIAG